MKRDYLNGTPYTIEQDPNMFHFGSDTELLGQFMQIRKKDHVLDIGCNSGALLLYAAMRHPASLTGIDLFPEVIALAEKNLSANGICADLYAKRLQDFRTGSYEAIVCNPPYFNTKEKHLKNENCYLAAARHEEYLNLRDLFEGSARLLKDNGRLYIVYRPSRLKELFDEADRAGLTPVRIRFAYQSVNKRAKTVLAEFRRHSNSELLVEEPAFLDDRSSYGWAQEE